MKKKSLPFPGQRAISMVGFTEEFMALKGRGVVKICYLEKY